MNIQIFGTKKCKGTQKAIRFFKERRVQIHFVDLKERPASPGELRRFIQKFGVRELVDRESKRFQELGLGVAVLGDKHWEDKLALEPLLLKTPLVRNDNQLTLGHVPEAWKSWVD